MKFNFKFFIILFGLISISLSAKETTIKIVTTKEEEETENEEEITKYILQLILTANEKIFSMQM